MDWKPISEASHDSKSKIVWCPNNKCYYMVSWGSYPGWGDSVLYGWVMWGSRAPLPQYAEPTYWISTSELPEPPHDD